MVAKWKSNKIRATENFSTEGVASTSAIEEVPAPVPVLCGLVHDLDCHHKSSYHRVVAGPQTAGICDRISGCAGICELGPALPGLLQGRCSQRIESPRWRDCPIHNTMYRIAVNFDSADGIKTFATNS